MKNTLLHVAGRQSERSGTGSRQNINTPDGHANVRIWHRRRHRAAPDGARPTLLQDEADELRVSFLGGDVQRRATSGVPHQQADASTDAFRQLQTGHTWQAAAQNTTQITG